MLKRICLLLFAVFPLFVYYAFDKAGSVLLIAVLFFILWMLELLFKYIKSSIAKNSPRIHETEKQDVVKNSPPKAIHPKKEWIKRVELITLTLFLYLTLTFLFFGYNGDELGGWIFVWMILDTITLLFSLPYFYICYKLNFNKKFIYIGFWVINSIMLLLVYINDPFNIWYARG